MIGKYATHLQEGHKLDEVLARAAVADWLACLGEYQKEGEPPVAPNALLGVIVAELAARARPAVDAGQMPPVQQVRAGACAAHVG